MNDDKFMMWVGTIALGAILGLLVLMAIVASFRLFS